MKPTAAHPVDLKRATVTGRQLLAANDPRAGDLSTADLVEIDRQFAPSREHRALQAQQHYLSCVGQLA